MILEFIKYEDALLFAKVALLLILVAVSYYILRMLAKVLRQNAGSNQLVLTIQKLIPLSRSIHVYASVFAGIAATTHAFFFLRLYPFYGIKMYSGIVTLFIFVIVASLGLALRRSRSNLQLRYQHRNAVVIFIIALLIHRLIN